MSERNCPLDILKNIAIVIALVHDSGKLSEAFFKYMEEVLKYGENVQKQHIDHSSAGGRIVEDITNKNFLSEIIATVVYSHHGLQDCINMSSGETLSANRRQKDIDYKTVTDRYFQIIDKQKFYEYLKKAQADIACLYKHITDFCKKTENKQLNCGNKEFYLGMVERLLLSLLIDSDWTDTASFFQKDALPESISDAQRQAVWKKSIKCFEEYMNRLCEKNEKSPLDGYRSEISDLCLAASKREKSLYRLTVPTGAGKTLSGLRFALYHADKYHKKHIYYVAPYTSILEQNAEEIRKAVGSRAYVLEHHCNISHENETEERKYRELTERWDTEIIATTAVQILNALFSAQKSSIRRMYNLCNSVIIFDEVQALPTRCIELFNLAVNFLTEFCNTTVVLCSATQPSLAKLPENNIFECTEMTGTVQKYADAFKRVLFEDATNLVPGGMSYEDLAVFSLKAFEHCQSVLVIVNTKSCAKKTYETIKRLCVYDCELYHLSTYMCPENRKDEIARLKEHLRVKRPVICVSTQLIEAGVNLSFSCVIRSLAGLDSIIQAAGRCNRHKDCDTMGKVYIIKMALDAERTDLLGDIFKAQRACEKFLDYYRLNPERYENSIDSETAVKVYYKEYFYDDGAQSTKYICNDYDTTLEDLLGKNARGCCQYQRRYGFKIKQHMNQAFRTAGEKYKVIQEDEKVIVVVPYDKRAVQLIDILEKSCITLSEQKKAVRDLQRYAVGISETLEKKLGNAIHKIRDTEIYVLDIDYYDKKEGVLENPKNRFLVF